MKKRQNKNVGLLSQNNPARLTMDAKPSQSVPQHMQFVKPKAKGWGRPNPICNKKEKTSKDRRKHGMIGQAYN
jgi:hypothetical protein